MLSESGSNIGNGEDYYLLILLFPGFKNSGETWMSASSFFHPYEQSEFSSILGKSIELESTF